VDKDRNFLCWKVRLEKMAATDFPGHLEWSDHRVCEAFKD